MSTKIQVLRQHAFVHQQGRCWYCGVKMWNRSPAELASVPPSRASVLRCTAEHLLARCDGGRDVASNLVAACTYCNHTRHKRKQPPMPEVYRADIRRRLEQGKWHQPWVRACGLL